MGHGDHRQGLMNRERDIWNPFPALSLLCCDTTKAVPSPSAAHTQSALMQGLLCCTWSRPGSSSQTLQQQRQVWEQRDSFQYFLTTATEPLRHLKSSWGSFLISSVLLSRTKRQADVKGGLLGLVQNNSCKSFFSCDFSVSTSLYDYSSNLLFSCPVFQ